MSWSPLNALHWSQSNNLCHLATQIHGETADYNIRFKILYSLVQSDSCQVTDGIGRSTRWSSLWRQSVHERAAGRANAASCVTLRNQFCFPNHQTVHVCRCQHL